MCTTANVSNRTPLRVRLTGAGGETTALGGGSFAGDGRITDGGAAFGGPSTPVCGGR